MKQSPKTHLLHQMPKERQREHSQGALNWKSNEYTEAPWIPPCSPFLSLKAESASWKNFFICGNGVPNDLQVLQTAANPLNLTHEERKSQVKEWSLPTEYLGVALWLEQEPLTCSGSQGGNSWHMRVANVCNRLHLCSQAAPVNRETELSVCEKEYIWETCF